MSGPDAQRDSPDGPVPCGASIDRRVCAVPHPHPFVCRVRVSPAHLSSAIEHVSNIEFVRWLDRAAELHIDYR